MPPYFQSIVTFIILIYRIDCACLNLRITLVFEWLKKGENSTNLVTEIECYISLTQNMDEIMKGKHGHNFMNLSWYGKSKSSADLIRTIIGLMTPMTCELEVKRFDYLGEKLTVGEHMSEQKVSWAFYEESKPLA